MYNMHDVYIFNSYPSYTWNISKMLWTTLNNFFRVLFFLDFAWVSILRVHHHESFTCISPQFLQFLLDCSNFTTLWISFSGIIIIIQYLSFTSVSKCACYLRGDCVYQCHAFCTDVRIESPAPSPPSECCSPLWVHGGDTRLRRKGWGGPNSDEGTDTLALFVYYNSSTMYTLSEILR